MSLLREILNRSAVEASAPCRIDMGGTLDLSTFYLPLQHLKPCTFNIALSLRTRVRLQPFEMGKLKISSRGFESMVVESSQAPFDHPLGLMLAVAAYFRADGLHIDIDSASPPRSALGGSSVAAVALIWAFAKALASSGQPMPERKTVALLAHAVEQSVAGVPCGLQDQLAATFGGINAWHWTADPAGTLFNREELVPSRAYRDFSKHLLVAYCGVPHASQDVNSTWVRQFVGGRHRSAWRQIVACSRQFITALAAGHIEQAQIAINREVDLRCEITPEVLDDLGRQLVTAARAQHSAARFTGAGGGGCVWALGSPEQIERLRPQWQTILAQRQTAKILDAEIDPDGVL